MPQNEVAPSQDPGTIIHSVIAKGDLARLSDLERTQYYVAVCQSIGLNPLTQPFAYINLNGKLTLYAGKGCTDQLRKINGISLKVVSREIDGDLFIAHVRAHDKTGRTDEEFGAVSIANLKGEARANAIMKGVTKAKRRATLSIVGLGMLDETEVDDIPIRDTAPPPISAAADLDKFAEVAPPEPVAERGSVEEAFDLPPLPHRRSLIWQQKSYHIAVGTLLDDSPDWQKWAEDFIYLIGEASGEELDKLWTDNKNSLNLLRRNEHSDRYLDITVAGASRRTDLHAEAQEGVQ